jgi:hypothetical protein
MILVILTLYVGIHARQDFFCQQEHDEHRSANVAIALHHRAGHLRLPDHQRHDLSAGRMVGLGGLRCGNHAADARTTRHRSP